MLQCSMAQRLDNFVIVSALAAKTISACGPLVFASGIIPANRLVFMGSTGFWRGMQKSYFVVCSCVSGNACSVIRAADGGDGTVFVNSSHRQNMDYDNYSSDL